MPESSSHLRAMDVFDRVCDLSGDEQAKAVEALCGGDQALRSAVQAMLRHDAEPMEALRDPGHGVVVDLLVADLARDGGPLPAEPQPVEIGPYRIIRKLGEGGMGVVYLAQQQRPQRVVALKVIRGAAASAATVRRFEREAHVLGLLAHPGIAQIFEAGATAPVMADGSRGAAAQPYLAMEFFDGTPITRFADERRLGPRQRMELVLQVCGAVEYAHQKGVIHRDLKPSNILGAGDGTGQQPGAPAGSPSSRSGVPSTLGATVKILDFGIARLVDADRHLSTLQTDVGQIIGTLQYMSPEQVSGDPSALDTRSDVYALGVVMYELLAGRLPYDLRSQPVHEAARIIRDETPTRMSAIDRAFRGDIETIVGKALEKEPHRRYQGAAELAADIRRFLDDQPIVARPATALEHVRKFVRRNRALSAAMAALALALVAGSVASSVLALRAIVARNDAVEAQASAEENARIADREAERARRKAYLANIAVAHGALAANDAVEARRWLDAVAPADRGTWEWRFIDAQLDRSTAVLLAPGSAVYCVDGSPDGTLLASAAWDGAVRLWDAATREVVAELRGDDHDGQPARPAYWTEFSPDGTWLLAASADRTVRVWNVATRRELVVCRGHEGIVACARFSPDGSMIASCSDDGTVRLWNAATGEALPQLDKRPRRGQLRSVAFSPDGTRLAVGCNSGSTLVYEMSGAEPIAELRDHGGIVYSAEFSPDGSRLAAASQDGTIRMWRTDDWWQEMLIDTQGGQVRHVAFSPDGATLAVALGDATVRLHDALDGRALAVLTGHVGNVTHVSWSADGKTLASTSSDAAGSIRLWDPSFGEDFEVLTGHNTGVLGIACSPDGERFTSVGTDREVRQWSVDTGLPWSATPSPGRRTAGDRAAVNRLSADGRWLLSVEPGGAVTRTDLATGRSFEPTPVPAADTITVLDLSRDGRWLVVGDDAGVVLLVAIADGAIVTRHAGVLGPIRSAAISDDGARLAAGDDQGRVVLWPVPEGEPIAVIEGDDRASAGLRFSADGSLLACASYGERARVVDGRTGEPRWTLAGHPGGARAVAISPDGRRIASGSGTGIVRLWDASTGEEIMNLRAGTMPIHALAFSRDGGTLAIGSSDRLIRLCRTVPVAGVVAARERRDGAAER